MEIHILFAGESGNLQKILDEHPNQILEEQGNIFQLLCVPN